MSIQLRGRIERLERAASADDRARFVVSSQPDDGRFETGAALTHKLLDPDLTAAEWIDLYVTPD